MVKVNTFICPIIRPDLVERMLETLYRHTPHNFLVYLIDQTPHGIDQAIIDKYVHLYLRPRRNLGFAKATNEGIKLVETPYLTMVNDDIEFINKNWWWGVLDTFDKVDEAGGGKCLCVTPGSTKLPDWSVGRPKGDDFYILPYKRDYTQSEYDSLVNDDHYVNEHLTIRPGSVIDGITLYCSVFKTADLAKVGNLDDVYYPGGADDYDLSCRAYMMGYRCVGTTLSWVYHQWSPSRTMAYENPEGLIDPKLKFEDPKLVWGEHFDIWGVKCEQCGQHMKSPDGQTYACPDHPETVLTMPTHTSIPL